MDNEALTSEDLVWIEADLRSQVFHFACRGCERRIILADKIKQTRGGLPLADDLVRRLHQEEENDA